MLNKFIEDGIEKELIESNIVVNIGEKKVFKNQILSFRVAEIYCEGTLEFDNCVIHYNDDDGGEQIVLAGDANLVMKNCTIICGGYSELFFVTYCDENDTPTIKIEDCKFINCSYFMAFNNYKYFEMTGCEIKNCYQKFIHLEAYDDGGICRMDHNMIICDGIADYYQDECFIGDIDLQPSCIDVEGRDVKFSNTIIKENLSIVKEELDEKLEIEGVVHFESNSAEISDCVFEGMSLALKAASYKNCQFVNCNECISLLESLFGTKREWIKVENCNFENCNNLIKEIAHRAFNSDGKKFKMINCEFVLTQSSGEDV